MDHKEGPPQGAHQEHTPHRLLPLDAHGLGLVEHDPSDVDWDLDLLDHMVPGIKSPGAKFTENDYEDYSEGKGRMCGDLSGMDWTKWAEDRLSRETRICYWGGAARNRIRLVGIHRQYKIRVCQECGEMLRTYEGADDTIGNYVRYIQDNPILSFAEHFEQVKTAYLRFKDDLRAEGMTLSDFRMRWYLSLPMREPNSGSPQSFALTAFMSLDRSSLMVFRSPSAHGGLVTNHEASSLSQLSRIEVAKHLLIRLNSPLSSSRTSMVASLISTSFAAARVSSNMCLVSFFHLITSLAASTAADIASPST